MMMIVVRVMMVVIGNRVVVPAEGCERCSGGGGVVVSVTHFRECGVCGGHGDGGVVVVWHRVNAVQCAM